MRKIFVIINTLILLIVSSLPMIACSNEFNDPNIYRITVVTDGHSINDHSFNESAYKAAVKFKKDFNEWIKKNINVPVEYKNKKIAVSWDNPQSTTLDNLMSAYNKAVFINSKFIIASGFLHYDALVKVQNTILKHKVKFIFVDGDTPAPEVAAENKELAGLQYKAEQSGFLAGLAGAIWLTAHAEQYGGLNNLKMTTYGGVDIPAVTNYMYGYYWAINLFNDKSASNSIKDELLAWVKILNPHFKQSLPKIEFVKMENYAQFSGNFVQGDKNSKAINDALVAKKSNIIFPVAGPQTEDTLASLQNSNNGKIIGVDTDQQQQYPQAANTFITSAKKNLVDSINYMLWKGFNRKNDNDHTTDPGADAIFNKSTPTYYGGKGFTGITDNEAIKVIHDPLLELGTTTDLLDKVSAGWQRVLKIGKNYWRNGIDNSYNPFS